MGSIAEIDLESLSPRQAQSAVQIVYDLLPDSAWAGGTKASLASFEELGDTLIEAATPESAAVIEALVGHGHEELKAAFAREALRQMAEDEALRPLVARAVACVHEEDMLAVPLVLGAAILALSLLPKVEVSEQNGRRKTKITWDPAGNAATLLEKLAGLLKTIPKSVLGSAIG